ncbi:MAG: VOC family protein, partial [Alphaproteobacteria bacterium]|nr:VOC family protein [Alphaproteobacteria bacterium]
MKLGAAIVFTPDLKAARSFYENVLGIKLVRETGTMLVFDCGGIELDVFRSSRPAVAQEHSVDASSGLAFEVTSLDEHVARLRAAGVEFLH